MRGQEREALRDMAIPASINYKNAGDSNVHRFLPVPTKLPFTKETRDTVNGSVQSVLEGGKEHLGVGQKGEFGHILIIE